MVEELIHFGVLGTGHIAAKFTEDLKRSTACDVIAVGSRTMERAEQFRSRFDLSFAHASYEALVGDAAVDVVYVAVPHPSHRDAAMLCLEAGKPVLVEKPFTMDRARAEELVQAARERHLFLMEAMWTRFLPQFRHIRDLLDKGRLGEVRTVVAEFGIWFEKDPEHRLYKRELGGGSLLDLGIYPVSLSHFVLGAPREILAIGDFTFTGVDAQTSVLLRYDGAKQALLTSTLEVMLPNRAVIAGVDARLEIDHSWHQPASFSVTDRDGTSSLYDYHEVGNGLRYQAEEVARCLREGLVESPIMPLEETLRVMTTMDEIRSQIGLSYAGD